MKVLGCKVEDEIYDQFASFGCISDTLREIVKDYLLKQPETTVNPSNSGNKYQSIREKKLQAIYRFLDSLEVSK